MHVDPTPHLFWITSRAAGFAALVLASLAVSLGLLMSTKLLRGRVADLRVVHEILSLSTIVAIVVHAGALLGDQFLHPSIADISIPFISSYKSGWTTLGIVSGWSMILLGLAYYARRAIGAVRWRKLHRFTALAWLAGLGHALGEGTDAGQLWFLAMLAIVAIPALGLLIMRWLPAGARAPAVAGNAAIVTAGGNPAPGAAAEGSAVRGPGVRDSTAGGPGVLPVDGDALHDLPARGVVPPPGVPRGLPVRSGG
jgi:methionine sulfoxide reductase heme-binding subunit